MQNNLTAGIILVGGKSSRMGVDKASLPYKNLRLVDYIANVLREAEIKNIFVSGEIEGYQSIPDLHQNKGPVSGICASIMECYIKHFDRAVLVPVDIPLLSAEIIEILINNSDAEASYFENHPLPLCLKINEEILKYSRKINKELKLDKKISVKFFLKNISAKSIKIPNHLAKNLTNTNTPEEWREVTK